MDTKQLIEWSSTPGLENIIHNETIIPTLCFLSTVQQLSTYKKDKHFAITHHKTKCAHIDWSFGPAVAVVGDFANE